MTSSIVEFGQRFVDKYEGTPLPVMEADLAKELNAEVATVKAQASSSRPKEGTIYASLGRIREILRSTADTSHTSGPVDELVRDLQQLDSLKPLASADGLYAELSPVARAVKVGLQMAIGAFSVLFLLIGVPIYWWQFDQYPGLPPAHDAALAILSVIAVALAAAAVVELAYTLYTSGPDEALDPIMLGIAAILLFQLSEADPLRTENAVAAFLLALTLGILFLIRRFLVVEARDSSFTGRLISHNTVGPLRQRLQELWKVAIGSAPFKRF